MNKYEVYYEIYRAYAPENHLSTLLVLCKNKEELENYLKSFVAENNITTCFRGVNSSAVMIDKILCELDKHHIHWLDIKETNLREGGFFTNKTEIHVLKVIVLN